MGYNENVTAGKTVSATVQYSNLNDSARLFDIAAEVNISEEKVTGFQNGVARLREEPTDVTGNVPVVSFGGNPENYFNIGLTYIGEDKALQAMTAIYEFMASVRHSVEG